MIWMLVIIGQGCKLVIELPRGEELYLEYFKSKRGETGAGAYNTR